MSHKADVHSILNFSQISDITFLVPDATGSRFCSLVQKCLFNVDTNITSFSQFHRWKLPCEELIILINFLFMNFTNSFQHVPL